MNRIVIVSAVCVAAYQSTTVGEGVTARIEPAKAVVSLGEPVIISTTVRNETPQSVTIWHQNAPTLHQEELSLVQLLISRDGTKFESWSDGIRPIFRVNPAVVQPGEIVQVDLTLLFNQERGFFATESGTIWIGGRIVVREGFEAEVPPVEIHVREPSASDREAWEWIDAHKEEYGHMVQVPWEAKLSDEFIAECARRCENGRSVYAEYLALFLGRSYREGPRKNLDRAAHFAEIAKAKASSEKTRNVADKLLQLRSTDPPPPPLPLALKEVDAGTQRAVAESLHNLAAALTAGRMDECATWLSDDFLYNGGRDKTRMLPELEEDRAKLHGGVVTIHADTFSGGPEADDVQVSGRLVAEIPGRDIEENAVRWVLRREGSRWIIRRWDRVSH